MQRVLGTARVWSRAVKEQRVYGGRLNVQRGFLVKAESGVYQTRICGYRYKECFAQQESGVALSKSSMYVTSYTRCALIRTDGLLHTCS